MTTMLPISDDEPKALDLYTTSGADYLRNIFVISIISLAIGVTPKLVRLLLPLGWVVDLCFAFALAGGYQLMLLSLVRGRRPDPKLFPAAIKYFWIYFAADFLYIATLLVGILGFGIPTIFLGTRFSLYRCFVADQNCGPIEALKKSWGLTKGKFWKLCGAYAMTVGTMVLVWVTLVQIAKLLHLPQAFYSAFIEWLILSMFVMLQCKIYVWLHDQSELVVTDVSPLPIELEPDRDQD